MDNGDVTGGTAPAMLFDEHDQFVAVWEHAADAMALSDAEGRVIAANPAYYELYGYRPDEILGRSFAIIFPPEERAQAEAQYRAVFAAADQVPAFEATVRRADGTPRIVEARYAFIMRGGRRTAMLSIIRDITERTVAEAALRARTREAELGAAVGAALTAGETLRVQLQHCAEAIVTHLDAAFARIWILNERQQVLELQASAGLYTHRDGPHGRVPVGAYKIGRIAAARQPYLTNHVMTDLEISDPDWARREGMTAFAGYPLLVGDRLVGVMGLFARRPLLETTLGALASVADTIALGLERARALEALSEERETLATLNHVGQLLVAELDLARLVQAVTDAATVLTRARFGAFFYNLTDERGESYTLYALSGVPRQAFAGIPLPRNTALFGLTFRGERVIRLDDVRQDGRYGRNPPYAGLPAGHPPVVSYLAVPVISRSGEVIGGLFFGHEQAGVFTEQAERLVVGLAAQAAVAVDNARLFQAAQQEIKARAGFLTTASHELRTPVATIKAYTQLLGRVAGRERLEQSRIVHLASQLEAQVGRLELLVNDLLDVTRIQHGRMDLRREWVDLTAVAAQVLARFEHARERTPEHRLVLEADEPVLAFLDRGRIDQVLTNLVSNAVKYSPDGGKVCVSVRADGGEVEVAVQDHGLGIPADEQGDLFQPFGRSESVRLSINGVGLGLYLTRQIVEQHGGTIGMRSTSGRGSTFTVRLPVGGETE